jgi:hypothetical protein
VQKCITPQFILLSALLIRLEKYQNVVNYNRKRLDKLQRTQYGYDHIFRRIACKLITMLN